MGCQTHGPHGNQRELDEDTLAAVRFNDDVNFRSQQDEQGPQSIGDADVVLDQAGQLGANGQQGLRQ